jgi:hypothetical protein
MNTFQILMSKPRFDIDALERFYRPWQMAYFLPFSNVFSIKTSRAARKKYLQYGGRPSMTSLQVLYSVAWSWSFICQRI